MFYEHLFPGDFASYSSCCSPEEQRHSEHKAGEGGGASSSVEWTGYMGYEVRDNYALTVLGHGVILHQGQTPPVFM